MVGTLPPSLFLLRSSSFGGQAERRRTLCPPYAPSLRGASATKQSTLPAARQLASAEPPLTWPQAASDAIPDSSFKQPRGYAFAFSRRFAPELLHASPSKLKRGRRECRVKASPMARLQQKKQAAVTTGSAGSSGTPCAMGYGLYRALPGDHRLVATVVREINPATLAPASERQDHTTSPSASATFVSRALRVHRIPAPRIVTIGRNVPLHRGGMRERMVLICPTAQARAGATCWHDGQFAHGSRTGQEGRATLESEKHPAARANPIAMSVVEGEPEDMCSR